MDAEGPGADVRARVFVPGLSVPEDPATGSACAALADELGQNARSHPLDVTDEAAVQAALVAEGIS